MTASRWHRGREGRRRRRPAGAAGGEAGWRAKTGARPTPRLPPGTVRRRGGIQGVASSPILVGAVTILVVIVAVFLAYNANNGLPFVSTYNLKAEVPNANALVKGNEVRIGGVRVGIVKSVVPVQESNGKVFAELSLSLDKNAEPLPVDSTVTIRPEVGARPQVPAGVARQLLQGVRGRGNDPAQGLHAGTGRHRRILRHVRRTDPARDPPEPGRLRQCPRRPRPAAERRDRRPQSPRRQQPAGAADDRRAEQQLCRLLAGARGSLGDRRPGGGDPGQPLRRPRPHLRRLRPRLPPLHPGNDRKRPADPRRRQRRPAGGAPVLP